MHPYSLHRTAEVVVAVVVVFPFVDLAASVKARSRSLDGWVDSFLFLTESPIPLRERFHVDVDVFSITVTLGCGGRLIVTHCTG